ncbi:unnamed protein product [Durusdinium trenchii]|uniref:Uncharacterized protein n=1 Tax=Durusdinium trenchii TaxID=1381693 RepID=A0ABP0RX57_9DINO
MLLLKACLHQHPFTYNKRGLSADFELSSPLSKSCDKVLIQEASSPVPFRRCFSDSFQPLQAEETKIQWPEREGREVRRRSTFQLTMFFDDLYEDFGAEDEDEDAAFFDGAPAEPMNEDDDDDQVYDFDDLDDGGGPARPLGPNGSHIPAPPTFAGNVEDEPFCLFRLYERKLKDAQVPPYPDETRAVKLLDGLRLDERATSQLLLAAGNRYSFQALVEAIHIQYPAGLTLTGMSRHPAMPADDDPVEEVFMTAGDEVPQYENDPNDDTFDYQFADYDEQADDYAAAAGSSSPMNSLNMRPAMTLAMNTRQVSAWVAVPQITGFVNAHMSRSTKHMYAQLHPPWMEMALWQVLTDDDSLPPWEALVPDGWHPDDYADYEDGMAFWRQEAQSLNALMDENGNIPINEGASFTSRFFSNRSGHRVRICFLCTKQSSERIS